MAGALSESAPRPVSVVHVEPADAPAQPEDAGPQQQQQQQQQQPPGAGHPLHRSLPQHLHQPQLVSTEAQTESPAHAELLSDELRDARRRERRMRRQHRRAIQRANGAAAGAGAPAAVNGACAAAAAASMPPTYPALVAQPAGPGGGGCAAAGPQPGHPPVAGYLHPPPPPPHPHQHQHPHQPPPPHPSHLGLRGLSLGLPFPVPASVSGFGREASPKQCCGLGSPPVRWSILGVGVVGLVCAGAGALLGALRATGRDHIAVALLMIGIGVVLVTVSAVAWRVTSRENCGGFFGLPGISGRIPPARPMHPYAAMIYPEFQFRTPPPSYQASMQEYRLRLLLLDRLQPTSSPPPTYRSNAGSYVATAGGPSSAHQGPANDSLHRPAYPRLSVSSVVQHHQHHLLQPSKKDANLVRIVQTESEPVILSGDQTPPCTAVEVLAHL